MDHLAVIVVVPGKGVFEVATERGCDVVCQGFGDDILVLVAGRDAYGIAVVGVQRGGLARRWQRGGVSLAERSAGGAGIAVERDMGKQDCGDVCRVLGVDAVGFLVVPGGQ